LANLKPYMAPDLWLDLSRRLMADF
jgi:hypothetical protein